MLSIKETCTTMFSISPHPQPSDRLPTLIFIKKLGDVLNTVAIVIKYAARLANNVQLVEIVKKYYIW